MSVRSVQEIISTLTMSDETENNIIINFMASLNELYSHPRDEISKMLIHIKDKDIFRIREELFLHCIDALQIDKFQESNIHINDKNPLSNLRKRYKADKCYDDIYILAMTIIEQIIHKDITKIINSSTPPPTNQTSLISSTDSAIIKELHNIRNTIDEFRKENKELKNKLNLALTKIDNQTKLINEIQKGSDKECSSKQDHYIGQQANMEENFYSNVNNDWDRGFSGQFNSSNSFRHLDFEDTINRDDRSFNRDDRSSNRNTSISLNTGPPRKTTSIETINQKHTNEGTSQTDQHTTEPLKSNNDFTRSNNNLSNTDHEDNDGFLPVIYKRKHPMYGTKNIPTNTYKRMAGSRIVRDFSLFVGGISNDIGPNDITNYLVEELRITPISVEINKINNYNRSYKITLQKKDKDIMFTSTNWEENIIIKPFRLHRNNPLHSR